MDSFREVWARMSGEPAVVQLRVFLTYQRRGGVPFDEAWPVALHRAVGGEWLSLVKSQKEEWRRAYDRAAPSRPEAALIAVSRGRDPREDIERRCEWCDGPIPPGRRQSARFCCEEHRKKSFEVSKRRRISDARTAACRPLRLASDAVGPWM